MKKIIYNFLIIFIFLYANNPKADELLIYADNISYDSDKNIIAKGNAKIIKNEEIITSDLIIYNDDVNTFEFVIESIIKICEHSSIQAEQCTWIIHHNGKCSVKRGTIDKLKPMAEAFLERGISAVIES